MMVLPLPNLDDAFPLFILPQQAQMFAMQLAIWEVVDRLAM